MSLLILDDFGFRRYESREAELLYAMCDERLGSGSIILTSNRPIEDWYSVFPDPVIGEAISDRLASAAIKLIAEKGRSHRKEGSRSSDHVTEPQKGRIRCEPLRKPSRGLPW